MKSFVKHNNKETKEMKLGVNGSDDAKGLKVNEQW